MDTYAAEWAVLAEFEPNDLTADERDSLEYYYASLSLADGLEVLGPVRRWCDAATTVARIAHMLGRLPAAGDPGATPQILMWIDAPRGAELNGYQRARIRSIPGGATLVS